jgi:hypothetical protein
LFVQIPPAASVAHVAVNSWQVAVVSGKPIDVACTSSKKAQFGLLTHRALHPAAVRFPTDDINVLPGTPWKQWLVKPVQRSIFS